MTVGPKATPKTTVVIEGVGDVAIVIEVIVDGPDVDDAAHALDVTEDRRVARRVDPEVAKSLGLVVVREGADHRAGPRANGDGATRDQRVGHHRDEPGRELLVHRL